MNPGHPFLFAYVTKIRLMKFPVCRQGLTRRTPKRTSGQLAVRQLRLTTETALSTSASAERETTAGRFLEREVEGLLQGHLVAACRRGQGMDAFSAESGS